MAAPAFLRQVSIPEPVTSARVPALVREQYEQDDRLAEDPESAVDAYAKTPIERRAQVESLDALHHRRRMLMREFAPLDALFGGGQVQMADAKRKQHRHLLGTLILQELRQRGEKEIKSETELERVANADPRHLAFCEYLDGLRVQWKLLETAVKEVDERIRDRQSSMYAYAREPME